MKHVDVKEQCLKDAVHKKQLVLRRIPGNVNPANTLTKAVPKDEIERFRKWMDREIAIEEDAE